jgi:hypothetical protein
VAFGFVVACGAVMQEILAMAMCPTVGGGNIISASGSYGDGTVD